MDRRHLHFTWEDADWIPVPATDGAAATYVLNGSSDTESAAVLIRYPADFVVPVHHHSSDYCSVVVKGSMRLARRALSVGHVRIVRAGVAYGPLVTGPDGCTVIDFFADRSAIPAVFPDDAEWLSVDDATRNKLL